MRVQSSWIYPGSRISRIFDGYNLIILAITGLMFGVMSSVVTLQVFCRYVLNNALLWPEEVARFLLVWITLLGSSVALYRGSHAAVTSLLRALPRFLRNLVSLLLYLCILVFLIIFAYHSYKVALISHRDVSPAIGISLIWPRLALPTGAVLMTINTVYLIYKQLISWVFGLVEDRESF